MEGDLNFFKNGRRPKFIGKGKTIGIFLKIEDDLKLNSKPNPPKLGLCTAQVMGFLLLF